jgi:ribose transport system ATP-binding protein
MINGMTKRFGGTIALSDLTMQVCSGEVVALLGQNGAGKSTLIKILAGIYEADHGSVLYRGQPYVPKPAEYGVNQPLSFIHQDLGLIEWMTIAENIAMALGYPRRRGLVDWSALEEQARKALTLVDYPIDARRRVSELTRSEKSMVAIARSLATLADVLVLDEPTASLPTHEVSRIFDVLLGLKQRGVGIIYVSHRLDEVYQIADRVIVLRDGRLVGERTTAGTSQEELVQLIVGRVPRAVPKTEMLQQPEALLSVRQFACGTTGPIDFEVGYGEIVGLVGLRGAGHEEVGRSLFGVIPFRGDVTLDGIAPNLRSTQKAMASSIGMIPRDRIQESIAPGLSVAENAFLNPATTGRSLFDIQTPNSEFRQQIARAMEIDLRPNNPGLPIESLSGGNQQKVVVGRWLASNCKLLIAEDPTAGVDAGAKAEIHHLISRAAEKGAGVLVVSTDFGEVVTLCHRVLIFHQGKIVALVSGDSLTLENIVHLATADVVVQ